MKVVVGILALQGAFIEHITYFKKSTENGYENYDFEFIEVRTPSELSRCHALVIPGGESTTMSLVAESNGLLDPISKFVNSEKPVWGTCAGLIFLSREVVNGKPNQKILGGLDIQVKRNAFGRQLDSFEIDLDLSSFIPSVKEFPTVFIRAPVISKLLQPHQEKENQVRDIIYTANEKRNISPLEVLCKLSDGFIVAVRQGHILGTSFHPELSDDHRFHKWFIDEFVIKSLR